MKTLYSSSKKLWLILTITTLLISHKTYATHAQSADITYQCLGGNQYQISVSFYRDCAGNNAPNTVSINLSSVNCNENFNAILNQIPGTGIDVTPICNTMATTCNGGASPGVEEYIYRGTVTLPANCTDWTFSFSLCCRNNAINTIANPGNENIYVEAKLNNFDYACNSSPTFSNPPVSFPCVGQTSCFNHGAYDADGDSLYYTLMAPATGPNTTVTYNPGYSFQQPLISNPLVSFNNNTGDICMTPTLQEVTVLAVKVEEWRDGTFIGSVIRDIQLRTMVCNNNLPYLSGINGNGSYNINACVGAPINFTIPSFDNDVNQTVTLNWNNAIPGANFTSNGVQLPTGTFNWTPTINDVSPNPYCFTINVSDDNCPINGVQVYSFCITVSGFATNATSTSANCNASNGTASATTQGGVGPFSYQWAPNGGNNANANGLSAGQYTVTVTDATGCSSSTNVTVGTGSAPGNINTNITHVACFGGNSGVATVNANGGQGPYNYLWSTGSTNPTINNLSAGTYWVQVTTNAGCISTDTITITAPTTPITGAVTQTDVLCFGGNNGTATITPAGGATPYNVSWNTTPIQNNMTATNLTSGNYIATITDNNGCSITKNITINQPQPLSINFQSQENVTCYGGNNGSITVALNGGSAPYNINWNNNAYPQSPIINNLPAGNYLLTVTDANGCIATTQFNVSQPTELITNIVSSNNISCNGLSDGAIQTNTIGGSQPYSFQWNPATITQPNISNLGTGHYTMTVTDNNGCLDTISATITEPTLVSTVASGNDTICPNTVANISASGYGGVGNYTYQWSNSVNGSSQAVSPNATTTYSVVATDANGCIGTPSIVTILVNDINLVNLSTVPDTNLCEGASYMVSANVIGGIGPYTFNWNNGLGQGAGPFSVTPLINTNYTVTITDVCGNTKNESISINVNPLPNILLQPQTKTECGEVVLNFENNLANPSGTTYLWNFGDNTNSTQETPNKTYNQSGVYNITLTLTSSEGCVNSGQTFANIGIKTKPVAQFEATPYETTMLNPEITFENYSIDATYYTWSFGDGENATIANPVHTYKEDGIYTITLITSNTFGCKDTMLKTIEIEPEYHFYIPNAFTPNNDGDNDIFTAVGEEIKEFNMQIFNRWGELIYETSDLSNGWNGTTKGDESLAMEGVYVYNIQLRDWEGLHHKFTGHVSLLK